MHRAELPKKEWVIGLLIDDLPRAYPLRQLPANVTVHDEVRGTVLELTRRPDSQWVEVKRAESGKPLLMSEFIGLPGRRFTRRQNCGNPNEHFRIKPASGWPPRRRPEDAFVAACKTPTTPGRADWRPFSGPCAHRLPCASSGNSSRKRDAGKRRPNRGGSGRHDPGGVEPASRALGGMEFGQNRALADRDSGSVTSFSKCRAVAAGVRGHDHRSSQTSTPGGSLSRRTL